MKSLIKLNLFSDLGHEKIVGILIRNGANFNVKEKTAGFTPLHVAASEGS